MSSSSYTEFREILLRMAETERPIFEENRLMPAPTMKAIGVEYEAKLKPPPAKEMEEVIQEKTDGIRPLYTEPFEQVVKKWLDAQEKK